MQLKLTLAALILVAAPAGAGEFPAARILQTDQPLNWLRYEFHGIEDKLLAAKELGVCVVDDLHTPDNFHFVDVDSSGPQGGPKLANNIRQARSRRISSK